MDDHKKAFARIQAEDRRLCILDFLKEVVDGKSNDFVLQTALERLGHVVTRTAVQADLRFLQEADLVVLDELEFVVVCQLTEAGRDVATGRTTAQGVKKPTRV